MYQNSHWKWFLGLNLACERKGVLDSSEESAEWSKKTCLLYKKKIKIYDNVSALCLAHEVTLVQKFQL